jgi:hypothetical protein
MGATNPDTGSSNSVKEEEKRKKKDESGQKAGDK